jgi:hypothetical protein
MHIFLAAIEGEVPAKFLVVPSGDRYRGRILVLHSTRERNTTQLLPKVPTTKGPSFGSL